MMTCALLALLLAPPPVATVKVYVGPQVRDGFVDIDKGVEDSIKDLKRELERTSGVSLAASEIAADIKLYVTRRGIGGASSIKPVMSGTVAVNIPVHSRFVEATLRVGDYERTFFGEDREQENWNVCAKLLVKNVSTWLEANRERVLRKP
jgi:hypothetical protein